MFRHVPHSSRRLSLSSPSSSSSWLKPLFTHLPRESFQFFKLFTWFRFFYFYDCFIQIMQVLIVIELGNCILVLSIK